MQTNTNRVKLTLTKIDSFLDLTYYKLEIEYWDKDKELKPNQSCLKLGDLLNQLFEKFDNFPDISLEIKIKNDVQNLVLLKQASGQVESKQGKLYSCRILTSSEKEAKKLRDNLKVYECLVN